MGAPNENTATNKSVRTAEFCFLQQHNGESPETAVQKEINELRALNTSKTGQIIVQQLAADVKAFDPPNSSAKIDASKSRLANPDLAGTPGRSSIIAATPLAHNPALERVTVANLARKKSADEPLFSPSAIWSSITAPTAAERSGRLPGPVQPSINISAGDLFNPITTLTGTVEMASQVEKEFSEHHRVGANTTLAVGTLVAGMVLPGLRGLRALRGAETDAIVSGMGESEALSAEAIAERNSARKPSEKAESEPGIGRAALVGEETIELTTAQRALEHMRFPTVSTPLDNALDHIAELTKLPNQPALVSGPDFNFRGARTVSGSVHAPAIPEKPDTTAQEFNSKDGTLVRTLMPMVDVRIIPASVLGRIRQAKDVVPVQYARFNGDGTRVYYTEAGDPAIVIDPNTGSNRILLPNGKQKAIQGVPDFILSGDRQVDLFFRSDVVDNDLRSSSVHVSKEDQFGSGVLMHIPSKTVISTAYQGPVQNTLERLGLERAVVDVKAIDADGRPILFKATVLKVDPFSNTAWLHSDVAPGALNPGVKVSSQDKLGTGTVESHEPALRVIRTTYHGPVQRAEQRAGSGATVDVTATSANSRLAVFDARVLKSDPLNDVAWLDARQVPNFISPLTRETSISQGGPVRFRGYGFNFLDPIGSNGKLVGRYPIVPAPELGQDWSKIRNIGIKPGVPYNPDQLYDLSSGEVAEGTSGSQGGAGIVLLSGQRHTVILRGSDIPKL